MDDSVWIVVENDPFGAQFVDKVFSNRSAALFYMKMNDEFLDENWFFTLEDHSVY